MQNQTPKQENQESTNDFGPDKKNQEKIELEPKLYQEIKRNLLEGNIQDLTEIILDCQKKGLSIDLKKIFAQIISEYLESKQNKNLENENKDVELLKTITQVVQEKNIDLDLKPFYLKLIIGSLGALSVASAIKVIDLANQYNIDINIADNKEIQLACYNALIATLKMNNISKTKEILAFIEQYKIILKLRIAFYRGFTLALAENNLEKIEEVLNLIKFNEMKLDDFFGSEEFKVIKESNAFLKNYQRIAEDLGFKTLQELIDFVKLPKNKEKLKKLYIEHKEWPKNK